MTGTPDCLLDPPELKEARRFSNSIIMDPLLDLVRAMRLSGGVFLDAEFTSPWCVSSHVGPEDYGAFLPAPAHVIAYHYVTEGRLLLRVGGGAPMSVGAGEIILLPRNEPHQLGSGPNIRPVSVDHLVQPATDGRPPRIVYGGGGERTRMLCGFLGSDSPNPPIASVLPASAHPGRHGGGGRCLDRKLISICRAGARLGIRLADRPGPARGAAVHRSGPAARRVAAGAGTWMGRRPARSDRQPGAGASARPRRASLDRR